MLVDDQNLVDCGDQFRAAWARMNMGVYFVLWNLVKIPNSFHEPCSGEEPKLHISIYRLTPEQPNNVKYKRKCLRLEQAMPQPLMKNVANKAHEVAGQTLY